MLANFKILSDTHNFHIVGELIILAMIVNFFVFYYLMNLIPSVTALYDTFALVMTTPTQTYLCMLFCIGMPFTIDRMIATAWS